MNINDVNTIGRRLRAIRIARGKSLTIVAGRAGISKSCLSDIETGRYSLDSMRRLISLANALQVSPSEIISLPIPAPGNGATDSATEQIRRAVMAVNYGQLSGETLPPEILQSRVTAMVDTLCRSDPERT